MERHRIFAALSCVTVLMLASACATKPPPEPPRPVVPGLAAALAPSGKLRVGVYTGSPTSYIAADDKVPARGVAYELAGKLAQDAGVPLDLTVFASNDKVLQAFQSGRLDLVFTNASAARTRFADFSPAVLEIEKGYLVRRGSEIADESDVDRVGRRVGVSRGSSSETELAGILRKASIVAVPSLDEGRAAVSEGRVDAFATNKAILFEMSDRIPGSRVLGNWGEETFAFGIPKGRPEALSYLARFVESERANGGVQAAVQRAGVRGLRP